MYAWEYSVAHSGSRAHCNHNTVLSPTLRGPRTAYSWSLLVSLSLSSRLPLQRLPLRFREFCRSAPDGCEQSGSLVSDQTWTAISRAGFTSKAKNCTRITVSEFSCGVEHVAQSEPNIVFDSEYSSSASMRMREPKLWSVTLSLYLGRHGSVLNRHGGVGRLTHQ
jgi:hypothetical protein